MVGFCDCCFIVLVFTQFYLPTQGTQLYKLYLHLGGQVLCFLLWAGYEVFLVLDKPLIAQTLSLRSSSSLSRSSSLWELVEVLVLASRAAFVLLTNQYLSVILAFKEACERRASILRWAFSTLVQKKGRRLAGQSLIWRTSGSWGLISSKRCFISSESWTKVSIGIESRPFIRRSWLVTPVGCGCWPSTSSRAEPMDAGSNESNSEKLKPWKRRQT
jgi:hypothetical protein